MNKYKLIDKVVAEIAKDKGISEGEVGTYDTLLKVADIAVKNCSIPVVVGQSEQLKVFLDYCDEAGWIKNVDKNRVIDDYIKSL